MPTVTSENKAEFDQQQLAKKGLMKNEPNINDLRDSVSTAITKHDSLDRKEKIANSKDAQGKVEQYIGKGKKLLSGNIKLEKAEKGYEGKQPLKLPDGRGVETTGLSFSPAYEEGKFKTCPNSASCSKECLGKTANGNYIYGGGADLDKIIGPRATHLKKLHSFLREPEAFATRLHDEIASRKERAEKNGNQLAVRLNVLSDIHPKVWESLIKAHPDVSFYDYTKNKTKAVAPNHHLTYSSTGVSQKAGKNGLKEDVHNEHQNWHDVRKRLDEGQNVAMPFSHRDSLPEHVHDEETGKKYKVIDGDTHDYRPLDKQPEGSPGAVIGLRKKSMLHSNANAAKNSKGFFTHYEPEHKKDDKGKLVRDENKDPIPTNKVVTIAKQAASRINLNNDSKVEK
jgi:hypothetical protein